MYQMSWERNTSDYKYETIQSNYSVEFDEYETERDLSLDELLEQELELEELDELEMML
jgi:hypothetical protein